MSKRGPDLSARLLQALGSALPAALANDPKQQIRAGNLVVAAVLAAIVTPSYAFFYQWQGHPDIGRLALVAGACALVAPALILITGRLAVAREFLTLGLFLPLLLMSFKLGGVMAPTVLWTAVCPLVATAVGGRNAGLAWSGIAVLGIAGIFTLDMLGHVPATEVQDLRLLIAVSTASFLLVVAVFLIVLDRNNAAAIKKLDDALAIINRLAITDDLTGLRNRREMIRLIEIERRRAQRMGTGFSVCLIDVDHFKSINDTLGHPAGDAVLKQLARCMQQEIRAMDSCGRYGGEEFVLLLPGANEAAAALSAERLRQAVAGTDFPALAAGRRLTISIGVAQYREPENIAQLLLRADTALYAAKHGGRNRVVAAGEHAQAPVPA